MQRRLEGAGGRWLAGREEPPGPPVPTHATHSQTCLSSCEPVFFSLASQCTPEVPRCPQPGSTHSAGLLQGLRRGRAPALLCHTPACDNGQGSPPARCHRAPSHRRLRAQSQLRVATTGPGPGEACEDISVRAGGISSLEVGRKHSEMHGGPSPHGTEDGVWAGAHAGAQGARAREGGWSAVRPPARSTHTAACTSDSEMPLGKRPHQLWALLSVPCLWGGGVAHGAASPN